MKTNTLVRIVCAVGTLLVSGCSTLDTGISQYDAGDYRGAFSSFQLCANEGDPICIGNIGTMYLDGTAPGGKDVERGLEYIELSARYGVSEAQQILVEYGREVPYADLQAAYEARKAAEEAEMGAAAAQLGCALGGGTDCGYSNQPPPSHYNRTDAYTRQPPPSNYNRTEQYTDSKCNSDLDCDTGDKCIRPSGSYGAGRCVTPVSKYGVRDYRVNPNMGVKEVSGCRFDTDCPVLFECRKQPHELKGLCMRR